MRAFVADTLVPDMLAIVGAYKNDMATVGVGNKNFLSDEGETARWKVESALVQSSSGSKPIGVVDPTALERELDVLTQAGVFASRPASAGTYDVEAMAGVYGPDGKVVWPKG